MQVRLQRHGCAGQIRGTAGVIIVTRPAGGSVAAPLGIIGCHLDGPVAVPAFFQRTAAVRLRLDVRTIV